MANSNFIIKTSDASGVKKSKKKRIMLIILDTNLRITNGFNKT